MKKIILLCSAFSLVSISVFAQVNQQFEGFNLSGYTEGGEKEWDVKGTTANVQGSDVEIDNVDANAYGEEDVNVTAKKGKINRATGRMELREDGVITSENGTQMKTDSLDWDREGDLLTTDDHVEIADENLIVKGVGLKSHPGMKEAKLNEDIQVEIDQEGGPGAGNQIDITCDGPLEMDQNKAIATFYNNVIAIEQETGRILYADKMDVYFDNEARKIKQIVCTGNVSVKQGDNISYSDSLIYKADEQRLIMTGKPRLLITTEGGSSDFDF